ncbi:hypothetical protein GYMLUDRAFT_57351 [Collybiopsis luxurians FD-317 M1]|uniref:Uncharacterized protein n=1 Tax=Collybiopsis luxurians FD-317 M1 TaxID=944289 RepID=A0A0D0D351_9AGAR|nr:hypothetical protein GYMLUDRAFT_57351 [Collybiopsis luxurians FD-317 M1]
MESVHTELAAAMFYLGNKRPLPGGCAWFELDRVKTFCVAPRSGEDIPVAVPFTIVGRVSTNLNNTGVFGGWSATGPFPLHRSRRTFHLGPPLSGVLRADWPVAIANLKSIQAQVTQNTKKVRYLFVNETSTPMESILRVGSKVFRVTKVICTLRGCLIIILFQDLAQDEGIDGSCYVSNLIICHGLHIAFSIESLASLIPLSHRQDPSWQSISETKALQDFPVYDEKAELIPLRRVKNSISGAIVKVTFSLRSWRYNSNDPFSFAADVSKVEILQRALHTTPVSLFELPKSIANAKGNRIAMQNEGLPVTEDGNKMDFNSSSILNHDVEVNEDFIKNKQLGVDTNGVLDWGPQKAKAYGIMETVDVVPISSASAGVDIEILEEKPSGTENEPSTSKVQKDAFIATNNALNGIDNGISTTNFVDNTNLNLAEAAPQRGKKRGRENTPISEKKSIKKGKVVMGVV